jgi:flavin reductase (DIM6/NTAB) family NADH-FMN oxidoreductase RutF
MKKAIVPFLSALLALVTGAPVLAQSVAYVECEVRQPVDIGNHTLFLGEVVNAAFLKDEATEVLRMEDTRMNYGG